MKTNIPEIEVVGHRKQPIKDNADWLNMFIGFRNVPVSEWPTGLEIAGNIDKRINANRKYTQDNKEYYKKYWKKRFVIYKGAK